MEGTRGNALAGARYQLASLYHHSGDKEKQQEAVKLLEEGVEGEHRESTFLLGLCAFTGTGCVKNQAKAVALWKRIALQHGDAAYHVAQAYEHGWGVPRHSEFAFEYYRAATLREHIEGTYKLALCYEQAYGTRLHISKAIETYRVSMTRDQHPLAFFNCSQLLREEEGSYSSEALQMLQQAARMDVNNAQFALATCYARGQGVPSDAFAAVFWWKKAAQAGHMYATHALACQYLYGEGVSRKPHKALSLFQRAVLLGHPHAASSVELCFQTLAKERVSITPSSMSMIL